MEEMIIKRVNVSDNKVKLNFKKCVWLFFDEINICDYLGFVCDVICYYYCKGKWLVFNFKIIVVCNLYRFWFDKLILILGF